jgi:cold-inducible RNA-binding protein
MEQYLYWSSHATLYPYPVETASICAVRRVWQELTRASQAIPTLSHNPSQFHAGGAVEGIVPRMVSSEIKELSMGRNLYVGNLSFSVGEAVLKQLFEQKGGVDSVTVMRDIETGRSRGFGFVEMSSEEDAQKAIKELNEFSVDGRNLTVNEARPKPERRGGFGGGGRGRGGQRRAPRW